jgi:glucose-6-phosphate isomerase
MTMKNIDPTETKAWKQLTTHYNEVENVPIKSLFANDNERKNKFTINLNNFEFDYSKNRITEETVNYLLELANEVDLKSAIEAQFSGEIINETEKRAVLHTALRDQSNNEVFVDGKNIMPKPNSFAVVPAATDIAVAPNGDFHVLSFEKQTLHRISLKSGVTK